MPSVQDPHIPEQPFGSPGTPPQLPPFRKPLLPSVTHLTPASLSPGAAHVQQAAADMAKPPVTPVAVPLTLRRRSVSVESQGRRPSVHGEDEGPIVKRGEHYERESFSDEDDEGELSRRGRAEREPSGHVEEMRASISVGRRPSEAGREPISDEEGGLGRRLPMKEAAPKAIVPILSDEEAFAERMQKHTTPTPQARKVLENRHKACEKELKELSKELSILKDRMAMKDPSHFAILNPTTIDEPDQKALIRLHEKFERLEIDFSEVRNDGKDLFPDSNFKSPSKIADHLATIEKLQKLKVRPPTTLFKEQEVDTTFESRMQEKTKLNSDAVKVLKARKEAFKDRFSSLTKKLKGLETRALYNHPTFMYPKNRRHLIKLRAEYTALLKEYKELKSDTLTLYKQDTSSRLIKMSSTRRKVQKIISGKRQQKGKLGKQIAETMLALDAITLRAPKKTDIPTKQIEDAVATRKVLSNYWVTHMSRRLHRGQAEAPYLLTKLKTLTHYDVAQTAKVFTDGSYRFLKDLMKPEHERLHSTIPQAMQARQWDMQKLIESEFATSHTDPPKPLTDAQKVKQLQFFLDVAKKCQKNKDPLTAEALTLALLNLSVSFTNPKEQAKFQKLQEECMALHKGVVKEHKAGLRDLQRKIIENRLSAPHPDTKKPLTDAQKVDQLQFFLTRAESLQTKNDLETAESILLALMSLKLTVKDPKAQARLQKVQGDCQAIHKILVSGKPKVGLSVREESLSLDEYRLKNEFSSYMKNIHISDDREYGTALSAQPFKLTNGTSIALHGKTAIDITRIPTMVIGDTQIEGVPDERVAQQVQFVYDQLFALFKYVPGRGRLTNQHMVELINMVGTQSFLKGVSDMITERYKGIPVGTHSPSALAVRIDDNELVFQAELTLGIADHTGVISKYVTAATETRVPIATFLDKGLAGLSLDEFTTTCTWAEPKTPPLYLTSITVEKVAVPPWRRSPEELQNHVASIKERLALLEAEPSTPGIKHEKIEHEKQLLRTQLETVQRTWESNLGSLEYEARNLRASLKTLQSGALSAEQRLALLAKCDSTLKSLQEGVVTLQEHISDKDAPAVQASKGKRLDTITKELQGISDSLENLKQPADTYLIPLQQELSVLEKINASDVPPEQNTFQDHLTKFQLHMVEFSTFLSSAPAGVDIPLLRMQQEKLEWYAAYEQMDSIYKSLDLGFEALEIAREEGTFKDAMNESRQQILGQLRSTTDLLSDLEETLDKDTQATHNLTGFKHELYADLSAANQRAREAWSRFQDLERSPPPSPDQPRPTPSLTRPPGSPVLGLSPPPSEFVPSLSLEAPVPPLQRPSLGGVSDISLTPKQQTDYLGQMQACNHHIADIQTILNRPVALEGEEAQEALVSFNVNLRQAGRELQHLQSARNFEDLQGRLNAFQEALQRAQIQAKNITQAFSPAKEALPQEDLSYLLRNIESLADDTQRIMKNLQPTMPPQVSSSSSSSSTSTATARRSSATIRPRPPALHLPEEGPSVRQVSHEAEEEPSVHQVSHEAEEGPSVRPTLQGSTAAMKEALKAKGSARKGMRKAFRIYEATQASLNQIQLMDVPNKTRALQEAGVRLKTAAKNCLIEMKTYQISAKEQSLMHPEHQQDAQFDAVVKTTIDAMQQHYHIESKGLQHLDEVFKCLDSIQNAKDAIKDLAPYYIADSNTLLETDRTPLIMEHFAKMRLSVEKYNQLTGRDVHALTETVRALTETVEFKVGNAYRKKFPDVFVNSALIRIMSVDEDTPLRRELLLEPSWRSNPLYENLRNFFRAVYAYNDTHPKTPEDVNKIYEDVNKIYDLFVENKLLIKNDLAFRELQRDKAELDTMPPGTAAWNQKAASLFCVCQNRLEKLLKDGIVTPWLAKRNLRKEALFKLVSDTLWPAEVLTAPLTPPSPTHPPAPQRPPPPRPESGASRRPSIVPPPPPEPESDIPLPPPPLATNEPYSRPDTPRPAEVRRRSSTIPPPPPSEPESDIPLPLSVSPTSSASAATQSTSAPPPSSALRTFMATNAYKLATPELRHTIQTNPEIQELIEKHIQLFAPTSIKSLVAAKNPKAAAESLMTAFVDLFKDIDLQPYLNKVLKERNIDITPEEKSRYKALVGLFACFHGALEEAILTHIVGNEFFDIAKNNTKPTADQQTLITKLQTRQEKANLQKMHTMLSMAEECLQQNNILVAQYIVAALANVGLKKFVKEKSYESFFQEVADLRQKIKEKDKAMRPKLHDPDSTQLDWKVAVAAKKAENPEVAQEVLQQFSPKIILDLAQRYQRLEQAGPPFPVPTLFKLAASLDGSALGEQHLYLMDLAAHQKNFLEAGHAPKSTSPPKTRTTRLGLFRKPKSSTSPTSPAASTTSPRDVKLEQASAYNQKIRNLKEFIKETDTSRELRESQPPIYQDLNQLYTLYDSCQTYNAATESEANLGRIAACAEWIAKIDAKLKDVSANEVDKQLMKTFEQEYNLIKAWVAKNLRKGTLEEWTY